MSDKYVSFPTTFEAFLFKDKEKCQTIKIMPIKLSKGGFYLSYLLNLSSFPLILFSFVCIFRTELNIMKSSSVG